MHKKFNFKENNSGYIYINLFDQTLLKCAIKPSDFKHPYIGVIHNYGLYNEIITLSQKSEKYNNKAKQTINDIFADNKVSVRDQITLGTLIKWAQEDDIIKTNETKKKQEPLFCTRDNPDCEACAC